MTRMTQNLLLATTNGLFSFTQTAQEMCLPLHTLAGTEITCVWSHDNLWLAGTPTGLLHSVDGGQHWQPANSGLTLPYVRAIAAPPGQAMRIFVGVEPAAIFVSNDGGLSWQECPEVAQMREQYGWYLPYSANRGCVRSFAFHGTRAYAAVEVGGLLCSDDGGQSWRLAGGSDGHPQTDAAPPYPWLHPDVHSVVIDPTTPATLWAATHSGLYRSVDGGELWQRRSKDCYCRALWLDPNDPQHVVFGPATRAEWDGHIEESFDGGTSWIAATDGLAAPWSGAPIEQMVANGASLFALRDDGVLLVRFFDQAEWQIILPQVTGIQAIAVADSLR